MKKILIITSAGGGGHISVANAITSYFAKDYIIETSYIFSDILGAIDPAQKLTGGKLNGEQVYNYFIRKKAYTIINGIYLFGKWYYKLTRSRTRQLFSYYLQKSPPDLVISVAPLINQEVLEVTKQLNIPFILIPTDFDCASFVNRIQNPEHPLFACTLPFANNHIFDSITSAHIDPQQIHIAGFPIRIDFFEEKNKEKLKELYRVPPYKPALLLLMGAMGSQETLVYVKHFIKLREKVHLIIALGKNKSLRLNIEKLKFPSYISLTILDYIDRMSDVMAITDILVTKSGTVSVCEAIYMNIPMLLDNIGCCLNWERMTHEIVQELKFGESISAESTICSQVTNLLTNSEYSTYLKNNLFNFQKPNSPEKLKEIITNLLA